MVTESGVAAPHHVSHESGGSDVVAVPVSVVDGETSVHSGSSPAAYTDLDLSSVVGAVSSLVFLKVVNGSVAPNGFSFRRKGDTSPGDPDGVGTGINVVRLVGGVGNAQYVFCVSDSAGVVQWIADSVNSATVYVMWHVGGS